MKLRKHQSTQTELLIYKQTILPYLEYCDFLPDACLKRDLDELKKLQYRAFRTVYKIRHPIDVPRFEILRRAGLKELKIRRKCHLLNKMFTWKSKGIWLKKQKRITRNQRAQQLFKIHHTTGELWLNILPTARQLENKTEFKNTIKKHFRQ